MGIPDTIRRWLNTRREFKIALSRPMEDHRLQASIRDIAAYFDLLAQAVAGVPSALIFNLDESGFQRFVDLKHSSIVVPRGSAHALHSVSRQEKRATFLLTVAADGTCLKPLLVVPRVTIEAELFIAGYGPQNCIITHSARGYITRDLFEHYVAQQVYANKDYYNDLIGTRYMAEGRFAEAVPYLERVSLDFISRQNISWYMANRNYTEARWFNRQLPNTYETDGPDKGEPKENLKLKYCKEMIQMQSSYNLATAGEQKEAQAYELAVRYYQASCYGDCWFLTHYSHSVNDSARAGELDFAAKAIDYLRQSSRSANLSTQYKSLYALAFIDIEPWYEVTYDSEYNLVIIPHTASAQYKALAALSRFAHEHPQNIDRYTTRCDVLKQFERLSK